MYEKKPRNKYETTNFPSKRFIFQTQAFDQNDDLKF